MDEIKGSKTICKLANIYGIICLVLGSFILIGFLMNIISMIMQNGQETANYFEGTDILSLIIIPGIFFLKSVKQLKLKNDIWKKTLLISSIFSILIIFIFTIMDILLPHKMPFGIELSNGKSIFRTIISILRGAILSVLPIFFILYFKRSTPSIRHLP